MKTEQITNLTTEELHKKRKTLTIAMSFIGVSVLIMIICGIILSVKKGFSAFTVTPISSLPLLIIFGQQLKEVKTELKQRETT